MMMRITIITTTIIILIQIKCMIIILRVIVVVFVILIILLHPMVVVGCWIQHCSTRRRSIIAVVVEDHDPFRQCRYQLQNHIVISMIIIRNSRNRIGIDIVLMILIEMIVF